MNMPADSIHTRRFRPRFVPTVATIAAIALFVAAGQWQHRRMNDKEALRAQFDLAGAKAPGPLPHGIVEWSAWRYRPVFVDGAFDATRQILIDNRIQDGHVGYHVVTPLLLADGRAVLVDRGWVATGESREHLPAAAPPAGMLTVQGRVNVPTHNYVELMRGSPAGAVWQNLDPARFSSATGLEVLPIVIEQAAPLDAGDRLVRNWPAPDFGIDRHRIYMMQWYLFAATAAGLWLYFNLRRKRTGDAQ